MKGIAALAAVVAVVLFFLAVPDSIERNWFDGMRYMQELFAAHLGEHPLTVAGAFLGLFALLAACGLPGASLLMLMAGAGFGMFWGTVLSLLASTAGATLSMLVARHWLRTAVTRRFSVQLARIDAGIAREGAFYLFSLRMAPLIPFAILNPLVGLTAMRTWTYFWVSAAGMAAGTALYVNAGLQLARVEDAGDLFAPEIVISLALLGLLPWGAARALRWLAQRRGATTGC
jgi:uncharacterized membrane protein YdjX (TVP38/TMEM64 family)